MKKAIIFTVAILAGICCYSCSNSSNNTDDSTVVDSVIVDSAVVDSIAE